MYTVMWKAHGIAHECRTANWTTAVMIQAAIAYYWHGDDIVVQIWDGAVMEKEEIS